MANFSNIHVIIPTLGKREYINCVIESLRNYSRRHSSLSIKIFVSVNKKDDSYHPVKIVSPDEDESFSVQVISPPCYQPSSETHLLWCLRWYKDTFGSNDAYIWPLTDNDPIVQCGFDAVVDFIANNKADVFFANNLWADTLGQLLPSPAFPVNKLIWKGPAATLFCGLGFEHATSTIGIFFIRADYLSNKHLDFFANAIRRGETCSHAWWMFEVSSLASEFALIATPLVLNKFNPHHFDHATSWKENAARNGVCTYSDWIIGYLSHLKYFVGCGILSYDQIRTSVISEPQRGILLFMDDILRRLFMQAKLALVDDAERFDIEGISLIKEVFSSTFPLRMPMINDLCTVLDAGINDSRLRLLSYKHALNFRSVEESQGGFSPVFRNAYHGYYCFEYRDGFVAVLRKDEIYKAYRDLDPVDIAPYIIYAKTESELLKKISASKRLAAPEVFLDNFDYFSVELREHVSPVLKWPKIQLAILSKSERFSDFIVRIWRVFRRCVTFAKKIYHVLFGK